MEIFSSTCTLYYCSKTYSTTAVVKHRGNLQYYSITSLITSYRFGRSYLLRVQSWNDRMKPSDLDEPRLRQGHITVRSWPSAHLTALNCWTSESAHLLSGWRARV